jgi:hypothetical protein
MTIDAILEKHSKTLRDQLPEKLVENNLRADLKKAGYQDVVVEVAQDKIVVRTKNDVFVHIP